MKVSEGGLLLERLAVEEQGASPIMLEPSACQSCPGMVVANDGGGVGPEKGIVEPCAVSLCKALEGLRPTRLSNMSAPASALFTNL